ncbi:MAG: PPC domain-containing DNA-binding protein [Candidatus Hodarchaeales archaeon]|jgi:predicted DNA-binding protein with PD1-like motif
MKFIHQKITGSYLIRLFPGEDIIESLQKFCRHHSEIESGRIQGIGALSAAKFSFFDGTKYLQNELTENLELVSLSGNIAQNEVIHIHGIFSRIDGSCIGGHIISGCIVSATCEIQILVLEPKVTRELDPKTNLNLLALPHELK